MNNISSQPGAGIFRSVSSILLIFILATLFLLKMEDTSRQVEEAAIKQRVIAINTALASVIYQTAVSGNLDKLNYLNNKNPFYYLALYESLPKDYLGAVDSISEIQQQGWYYFSKDNQAIYRKIDGAILFFYLDFNYNDVNANQYYDPGKDIINALVLKKAP